VEVRVGKEGEAGMEETVRVEVRVVEGEVGAGGEVQVVWAGRGLGMAVKVLAGLVVMELQGAADAIAMNWYQLSIHH
jgi:hypothetical protein